MINLYIQELDMEVWYEGNCINEAQNKLKCGQVDTGRSMVLDEQLV